MADLYRNCELDTIINFLAKQGISKSVDSTPAALKDSVINRYVNLVFKPIVFCRANENHNSTHNIK